MNIFFIMPGLGFGGAERVVSNLANEFVENKHKVSILLLSEDINSAYPINSDISVFSVSQKKGTLDSWLNVRKECRRRKPDVVIAFMSGIGILSALFLAGTGIPVITSERNDPQNDKKNMSSTVRMLGKLSPFFTRGYVFQSEGAKSYYSKKVQKKSCIILNPMNAENFPVRSSDEIDNRIVSVGRLHPQKNQQMLIRAFAMSRAKESHTLHIFGDGELREELENLIFSLDMQDKVFLEGNSRHVHEDIKNAKLFVFTSDYEGLPNALMEAMALGLPCISTDCSPGGARMLIENGENGIIVPCGDIEKLSLEMDKLCEEPSKLAEFGKKAQLVRERTEISTIANEWIEFITRCIK